MIASNHGTQITESRVLHQATGTKLCLDGNLHCRRIFRLFAAVVYFAYLRDFVLHETEVERSSESYWNLYGKQ